MSRTNCYAKARTVHCVLVATIITMGGCVTFRPGRDGDTRPPRSQPTLGGGASDASGPLSGLAQAIAIDKPLVSTFGRDVLTSARRDSPAPLIADLSDFVRLSFGDHCSWTPIVTFVLFRYPAAFRQQAQRHELVVHEGLCLPQACDEASSHRPEGSTECVSVLAVCLDDSVLLPTVDIELTLALKKSPDSSMTTRVAYRYEYREEKWNMAQRRGKGDAGEE